MRKRLTLGLAVGAAAAMALAGCGSSSGSGSSGTTTLSFFGADYGTGPANSTSKYWDAIAAAFHKANPAITVNVQTVDWTDFPNKVQTLVQNKQFPDILEGDTAPQFAQSHLLYSDSQVLSPAVLHNLMPTFLKDGQYQGTDYGIPFTTSTRALYYNKKIFATGRDLVAAEDLGAAADRRRGDQGQGLHRLRHAARQRGGTGRGAAVVPRRRRRLREQRGRYAINAPQNVETLTFMSQLVKAGDTQPSPGTTDRKDVWAPFAQGRVGMMLGSPAVIPIIQAAGTLQLVRLRHRRVSRARTARWPPPSACTTTSWPSTPAVTRRRSRKFLDFAYQDRYQLQFDKEYDLLPATTSAAARMAKSPEFAAFLTNIPNSVNYPAKTNWTDGGEPDQDHAGPGRHRQPGDPRRDPADRHERGLTAVPGT